MPNAITRTGYQMLRELLASNAAAAVAQYPQYEGFFDDNVLVAIKRDVVTKGGPSFARGDIVLAQPIPRVHPSVDGPTVDFTCWSPRRDVHCAVPAADLEFLAITD
jgi:hypothetical protein